MLLTVLMSLMPVVLMVINQLRQLPLQSDMTRATMVQLFVFLMLNVLFASTIFGVCGGGWVFFLLLSILF